MFANSCNDSIVFFRRLQVSLSVLSLLAISTPAIGTQTKLRVGIAGSAPFTVQDSSTPEGISVEIWREIAEAENLEYEIFPQKGVKTGLNEVVKGQLDILIGPISITADRLEKVAFTQPYFTSEIGLLLPSQAPTLWNRVKPLFQVAAISSVGFILVALFIVGNLLWLAEHRRNPEQFPKSYWQGVGNGMWFALVTLTTVGYGDKSPVTKTGRFVTSVWMVITMVTASSLTAGLATAFTLSLSQTTVERFEEPQDLRNARIAVVSGTTGAEWAERYQARLLPSTTLEEAIAQLLRGEAEGVVFDVPALRYYLQQNPQLPLSLTEFSFATEDYGFAVPLESPLIRPLNVKLLQLKEEGTLKAIEEKWMN